MSITNRIKHAWNVFSNSKDPPYVHRDLGIGYSFRPDRIRFTGGNERSIVTSVYNQIALDVAAIDIRHAKLDEDDRYLEDIQSELNERLTLRSNLDQTSRAFIQDVVISMFDEGCVAIVPVDINTKDDDEETYDISSIRTGQILEWFPEQIKVRVYNERTGRKEDVLVNKKDTVIIENPFRAIMNEPNSTMKRLIRKLNLLDAIDEQSGSGKLDLIVQLPYTIKTTQKKALADQRRKELESQLSNSKFGIGYIDAAEKVTQLNRPIENNLMKQIEYLTNLFYAQLGITQSIMDGTANEETMLNYYSRVVEPIISLIVDDMRWKWLSDKQRREKESIVFFRDPFKLVPINDIAEIADKFTRNEIATSNEIRQVIGMKPSKDPKADMLVNSNINQSKEMEKAYTKEQGAKSPPKKESIPNSDDK